MTGRRTARARRRIAGALTEFLEGPILSAMPGSFVRSIAEASSGTEVHRHLVAVLSRDPPVIEEYPFTRDAPLFFQRSKSFDTRRTYLLRDVLVSPTTGLTFTPGGLLLGESVGSLNRFLGWGDVAHVPLETPAPSETNRPILVLPSTGYFHWLCEYLPAALRGLRSPVRELELWTSSTPPGYVEDWLRSSGVGTIRRFDSDRPRVVRNLVLPSLDEHSGFIRSADISHLREHLLRGPELEGSAPKRDVYVSRTATTRRRLANEPDVERLVEALGFEIVRAESMSVRDQVQLFADSRRIVAPHGAGLSNIVWARPPCRVLEIFPSHYVNDCYGRLSLQRGLGYEWIRSLPDRDSAGAVPLNVLETRLRGW